MSNIKTIETKIQGIKVECTQFPVRTQLALMAKLGRIISPVIAAGGINLQADVKALGPALMELFTALDDGEIVKLCCSLLTSTSVYHKETNDEGKTAIRMITLDSEENIDHVCNGNLMMLLQCAKFAIEANYKSFFSVLGLFMTEQTASS